MLNTGGRRICVACRYFYIWKGRLCTCRISCYLGTDPLLKDIDIHF
ncbi:hypothetical protein HMPREF1548_01437 [Clostridium sp. KLE 1755]|nr:hypothetical protein HMPREF1548_01437 [Clostridium sp. KLE 1755]